MANNQQQTNTNEITTSLIKVKPQSVIWNIDNYEVENFVKDLLVGEGIDGVKAVTVTVDKAGVANSNMGLECFIIFDQNSKDINSTNRQNNGGASILNAISSSSKYQPSDKLRAILNKLAFYDVKQKKMLTSIYTRQAGNKRVVYTSVDIFKVLAMMFCADRKKFNLKVMAVVKTDKGGSLIQVGKTWKQSGRQGEDADVLRETMSAITAQNNQRRY